MHSAVVGLLVVGASVAVALAGLLLVRRLVPLRDLAAHRDAAGLFSGLLGTIYGVLLAFVVFVVWSEFEDTRRAIDAESNRLGDLSRLAKGSSPEGEQAVRRQLVAYLRAVIEEEWPAMRQGRDSPRGWQAIQQLWDAYRRLEPRGERETAVYAESLDALADVSDGRRARLAAARETLSGLMWTLLWGGAAVVVGITFLFATESLRAHCLMTAALATLVGFNLFLIYALDQPFRLAPGIGSERFAAELARISDGAAE